MIILWFLYFGTLIIPEGILSDELINYLGVILNDDMTNLTAPAFAAEFNYYNNK